MANNPRRHTPWAKINRCIVCGTKLTYTPSPRPGAKRFEGEMYCINNHRRFAVSGSYVAGAWTIRYCLPE